MISFPHSLLPVAILAFSANFAIAEGKPVGGAAKPRTAAQMTSASRRSGLYGPYRVEVLRVLDGDTFEGRIRIWFGQEIVTLVRLRGIDAPELKAQCGAELVGAQEAREGLADMLASGQTYVSDINLDKYGGRVVASVQVRTADDSHDISAAMIGAGWARAYAGGRRDSWCAVPSARR